jgi:CheY-like chemotaxis protein
LRSYGYTVSCVPDGQSALKKVAQEIPDCGLLDLEMPDMSGFEVLAILKESHPDLPVLVVTASVSKFNTKKALEAGAAGYLLKPFDPEKLRSEVARILDSAPFFDEGER